MQRSGWALGLVAATLVACNPFKQEPAVSIDTGEVSAAERWNGTLATPSNLQGVAQVRGEAWMARNTKGSGVRAHVQITNATPGAEHPWHVHRGQCGYDQGIVGSASDYEPLRVNDDGRASRDATLDMALPRTGEYFVNVHASASNLSTIVACGNLAPPVE
jgi:hypothetical protein